MSVRVGPSILAADFARLADEISTVEKAGADLIHLDVMDAHFVPNLTFGPMVVEAVSRISNLFRDTHLMVTDPDTFLDDYLTAGANRIDFHLEPFEASERSHRADAIIERLQAAGVEAGIAVNPETPVDWVYPYLDRIDAVLIMTVHPGFGGQVLIQECVDKIPHLAEEIAGTGRAIEIGVDGGVTIENAGSIASAGATMLVAGSAVFRAPDPSAVVGQLQSAG